MPTSRWGSLLPAFALGLTLAGCSDGTAAGNEPQLNFQLAVRPAAALAGPALAPEILTDGTNTLELQQVQLVLSELELERADRDVACDNTTDDDACEELEAGPLLLDLPLGTGGAARSFSVPLAPGTYDEVEFEFHKPEDGSDDRDAAFLAQHPEFAGVSIRVTGTFNGTPFTYESDMNIEQELDLSPPLVVAEAAATDLTLFVDVSGWFRMESGELLDPATANTGEPNEGVVRENIKNSLEAFEDEDGDGDDDADDL